MRMNLGQPCFRQWLPSGRGMGTNPLSKTMLFQSKPSGQFFNFILFLSIEYVVCYVPPKVSRPEVLIIFND